MLSMKLTLLMNGLPSNHRGRSVSAMLGYDSLKVLLMTSEFELLKRAEHVLKLNRLERSTAPLEVRLSTLTNVVGGIIDEILDGDTPLLSSVSDSSHTSASFVLRTKGRVLFGLSSFVRFAHLTAALMIAGSDTLLADFSIAVATVLSRDGEFDGTWSGCTIGMKVSLSPCRAPSSAEFVAYSVSLPPKA